MDGPEGTDGDNYVLEHDTDYQLHTSTVTLQFTGFESHLHGVVDYEWAVGTTPGGEDTLSYTPHGLIHSEEDNVHGNGKWILGFMIKYYKSKVTKYFSVIFLILMILQNIQSSRLTFYLTSPPGL